MTTTEKISIALPPEMVAIVRDAVAMSEYASSSEVIHDALQDWTFKRTLRQQGMAELHQLWPGRTTGQDVGDCGRLHARALNAISGYRRCRRHDEIMRLELSASSNAILVAQSNENVYT